MHLSFKISFHSSQDSLHLVPISNPHTPPPTYPFIMPSSFSVWANICILQDPASCLKHFLLTQWWWRALIRRLREWLNTQHPTLEQRWQQISHVYSCRATQVLHLVMVWTSRGCGRWILYYQEGESEVFLVSKGRIWLAVWSNSMGWQVTETCYSGISKKCTLSL